MGPINGSTYFILSSLVGKEVLSSPNQPVGGVSGQGKNENDDSLRGILVIRLPVKEKMKKLWIYVLGGIKDSI